MKKPLQEMAIFPALMGLLAATACAPAEGPDGWTELTSTSNSAAVIRVVGTVRHLDVEGGQYVIVDPVKETRYNPTNLPGRFQVDGTAVEADAVRREGEVSIGMVGPVVDLIRIRFLPLP
jgi:hypothetical protein